MRPDDLRTWLAGHAESLDAEATHAPEVVPRLARTGLFGLGVPQALGGQGGSTADAVEAIAAVAGQSLAAAFVFWGQRSFIEYLLQSPNAALRERALPALLRGDIAGASGLSNAMKYLGGIAELQVNATDAVGGQGWLLKGRVPWCTNLRGGAAGDFLAAVAVQRPGGGPPFVAALPAGRAGLLRSPDLDLIALRGSNTAALDIDTLPLDASDLLHPDANTWLPQVRPAFLALQCGLSIGLARAALATAAAAAGSARCVLAAQVEHHSQTLCKTVDALKAGLQDGSFVTRPAALFRLRLALSDLTQQAVQLELLAGGGKAYHRDQPLSFARRWREAAFIPIVTPSVTQLQGALQAHDAARATATSLMVSPSILQMPQTAPTPLLQAEGLSFGYGGAPPLFDDVSLSVAPCETVCLLGSSGCGKSTLLRVLARLAAPRAGTVRFEGQLLQAPHPRAALVFQQPGLLPWLNVARNVAFGLAFKRRPRLGTDALRVRVDDALAAVGLAGHGALYPAQLSGGMAQRVALARALAREPALLLADEPFSALDAITRADMQRLLVEVAHRRRAATLLVTHDVDEALLVADRILLMGGRPGGVLREWTVAAPRPRERHMPDLAALRFDILHALQASHAPAAPA